MAIWDRDDRALWLVRDRFGKKPLYYGRFGHTVLFASELKAICVHPKFQAELDTDAVASYLRFNCIPAPLSIYSGVRKLAAASWLRITRDGSERGPMAYWSLSDVVRAGLASPFEGSGEEAIRELDHRLRCAIRSRMLASDVPVGLFLSGGVDSSTVTALAQAQSSIPIRTFSIGMSSSAYDESSFARGVARHLGTDHTELQLTSAEAMSVIPELPGIYDEPFADSSAVPTLPGIAAGSKACHSRPVRRWWRRDIWGIQSAHHGCCLLAHDCQDAIRNATPAREDARLGCAGEMGKRLPKRRRGDSAAISAGKPCRQDPQDATGIRSEKFAGALPALVVELAKSVRRSESQFLELVGSGWCTRLVERSESSGVHDAG